MKETEQKKFVNSKTRLVTIDMGKTTLLGIVVFIFIVASVGEGAAFQDMICKSGIPTGKQPKTCKTSLMKVGLARMVCDGKAPGKETERTYDCTLVVREQGPSTPYAHTSRIWHCTAGNIRIYLFYQDFFMDAERCKQVCGRCEGNWKAATSSR